MVRACLYVAVLTVEKIFMALKKETVDKIKEVPVIKAAYNEKLAKLHHHLHKGAPASAKTTKLNPHDALHKLK